MAAAVRAPEEQKKRASSLSNLQAGNDAFYSVPTLLDGGEALLGTLTAPIAAATAPHCMHYDTPPGELPLLWSRQEWEELEARQAREPIFNMEKVHACFNREAFERDGYVVWRGIMTDEAQQKWTKVSFPPTLRFTSHCAQLVGVNTCLAGETRVSRRHCSGARSSMTDWCCRTGAPSWTGLPSASCLTRQPHRRPWFSLTHSERMPLAPGRQSRSRRTRRGCGRYARTECYRSTAASRTWSTLRLCWRTRRCLSSSASCSCVCPVPLEPSALVC